MEKEILLLAIEVLSSPRDRLRRLEVDHSVRERVRAMLKGKAPHAGLDTLDQCCMLLQVAAGVPVTSVMDVKR